MGDEATSVGKRSIGTVEQISADRTQATGWVGCTPGDREPRVACLLRGEETGTVELGEERSDVQRKLGLDNRRFTLVFPKPLPPGALASGEATVVVASRVPNERLRLGTALNERERVLLKVQQGTEAEASQPPVKRRIPVPSTREDLVPVHFPLGLVSAEGDAILGRDGYLFLIGGTNKLRALYASPETDQQRIVLETLAQRWKALFLKRKAYCDSAGIRYVQCIIPEKLTVLRDLLDGPPMRTPLLDEVERAVQDLDYCVNASGPFLQANDRKGFWSRNDTHLSPFGAWNVMGMLGERLGLDKSVLSRATFEKTAFYRGDLSRRVIGIGLWEAQMDPIVDAMVAPTQAPALIESAEPPGRGHIGTRRVWKRDDAPFDLRVVAFANSFFDTGETASRISWWASRLFREFHFVWGPDFDFAYLDRVRPNIVIGQTIERFLPRVAKY